MSKISGSNELSVSNTSNAPNALNVPNKLWLTNIKYQSTRRVYQIWRDAHPPIDLKDIKPLSEEPGSTQQADPVECNIISGNVLDLYKKTENTLEGIKARGRPLITK
ncbi:hypothetical protein C1645_813863 [Glomus cerebriforme]|uniref:Uncharacterized protein n=1 Tax=Glomus cerebriforme TaxID=658196 RepID=A0A397TI61_9GLOM|nr:hypothetical protein C1645_813863 [Glomus cerebriforme]